MAGNYPDYPSWRMAYDRDGTQVYKIDGVNNISALTTATLAAMNDESAGQAFTWTGQNYMVFIFPELRDLDAFFIQSASVAPYTSVTSIPLSVSTDTTNGIDGTWASIGTASVSPTSLVKPAYRTGIVSSSSLAIRALKLNVNASGTNVMWAAQAIHLFGEPAPGENPNRLELWHPTLDERVPPAYFDWGNVPRSSSADRPFRVKNNSSSQTAQSIRVAMEALTDTTPSVPAQHTLSYNGGSFLPQVNIGDLAPGAISGPVTMRRITPSDATLSLWSFRVFAESTSWV
jgi:hypothetical protein